MLVASCLYVPDELTSDAEGPGKLGVERHVDCIL